MPPDRQDRILQPSARGSRRAGVQETRNGRARAMRDGCFMRARSRRGKGGRTTRTTAGLRNGLWHFSLSLREGATATEGEGVCKILLLVCPCWRRLGFFTTRGRTDADGREDNCHIAPFPDWPGGWVLVTKCESNKEGGRGVCKGRKTQAGPGTYLLVRYSYIIRVDLAGLKERRPHSLSAAHNRENECWIRISPPPSKKRELFMYRARLKSCY